MNIVKLADAISSAPECASWLYQEWGHRRSGNSLSQSVERFLARAQGGELPMAFVAFADGVPVGTASLLAVEDASDTFGPWLGSLYVLPKMRRSGVARELIVTVEAEALILGFRRLWLSASSPEMYGKFGYRMTPYQKHGEPIMAKSLD